MFEVLTRPASYSFHSPTKKGPEGPDFIDRYGGERGIRTLDRGLTYTPLAGERLQPLGHLSGARIVTRTYGYLSMY